MSLINKFNERWQVMTKIISFLFLICCHSYVSSQTFQDCISIDFEHILNTSSSDGLSISNQFQDTFGLSFSIESGGFPVLAKVGAPRTAFGSSFGPDTPAPDQGIGSFFLTDDGVLEGLNSPPIILDFESPVDSFSGCILDMDFGELFIIHARDNEGQIILADTVFSSDPGTGDGRSTCWGFNLAGCEGSVFSIRFQGQRTEAGAFGMGIDNLIFCQSGIDIANVVEFETTLVACDGSPGSIRIINSSSENFTYSIDGINFQSDPIFENLNIGLYTITVQDIDGCAAVIDNIFVGEDSLMPLAQINALNTSCDLSNGSIEVITGGVEGISYSIDGVNFQDSPLFENLESGTYTVFMLDTKSCESQETVSIENIDLIISSVLETDTKCDEPNGSLLIFSTITENVSYSIDGTTFQEEPVFMDLRPDNYTVFITDNRGCMDMQTASILPSESVFLDINPTPDWCNDTSGVIFIQASGGNGNFLYSIDNGSPQPSSTFSNLISNTYSVNVEDDEGCSTEERVIVEAGSPIIVNDLQSNSPTCEDLLGSILIDGEGGNGLVSYSLNGSATTFTPAFLNLAPGEFSIVITDASGCQDSLQTRLDFPTCPIYIPNGFSPEDDGINDFFKIFTNSLYDIEVLQYAIFDRWGTEIWMTNGFSIHTAEDRTDYWDGTFRDQPCMSGVYVYMIEVRHLNGAVEFYSGDVTLVR